MIFWSYRIDIKNIEFILTSKIKIKILMTSSTFFVHFFATRKIKLLIVMIIFFCFGMCFYYVTSFEGLICLFHLFCDFIMSLPPLWDLSGSVTCDVMTSFEGPFFSFSIIMTSFKGLVSWSSGFVWRRSRISSSVERRRQIRWGRGGGQRRRHDPVDVVSVHVRARRCRVWHCAVGHSRGCRCRRHCRCRAGWLRLDRPLECCSWKNHVADESLNRGFADQPDEEELFDDCWRNSSEWWKPKQKFSESGRLAWVLASAVFF